MKVIRLPYLDESPKGELSTLIRDSIDRYGAVTSYDPENPHDPESSENVILITLEDNDKNYPAIKKYEVKAAAPVKVDPVDKPTTDNGNAS